MRRVFASVVLSLPLIACGSSGGASGTAAGGLGEQGGASASASGGQVQVGGSGANGASVGGDPGVGGRAPSSDGGAGGKAESGGSDASNESGGSSGVSGATSSGGATSSSGAGGSVANGGTGGRGGSGGSSGGSVGGVSFANVQAIFDAHCVACHDKNKRGLPSYPALSLVAGDARAALVSQPALEPCGGTYVTPGDPAHSYLIQKLTLDPPCSGAHMPAGFEIIKPPPLTTAEIAGISGWISAGAQ